LEALKKGEKVTKTCPNNYIHCFTVPRWPPPKGRTDVWWCPGQLLGCMPLYQIIVLFWRMWELHAFKVSDNQCWQKTSFQKLYWKHFKEYFLQ